MTIGEPNSDRFDGPLRFRRSPGPRPEARRGPPEAQRSAIGAALEWAALIYAILIFSGMALFGRNPDPNMLQESNPIAFYSNIFILLTFGLLVFVNRAKTADFLPFSHLLMVFLAIALFSALWSLMPGVTLRRFGTLMTTILAAAYVVMRFDLQKGVTVIGHGVLIVVALSILTVIFLPHIGITQPQAGGTDIDIIGTWKGVLPHKNSLGWICTAGVQIYAWRFLVERDRRLRHAACVLLFVFVAGETRSSTAIITIVISLALVAVLSTRSRRGIGQAALEWGVVAGIVLLLAVVLLNPADVMALIGKSADMTGRFPLWRDLMVSIEKRPLLGYGYGAFWVDLNDERVRIWALNPWQPPDAHNAYIEIALQLGIVGAVAATLLLLVATKRAIDWCKDAQAQWAIYVATFLIVYVVTNVDETQLFRGGDFHCFMLAFCYFTLIRAKQRAAMAASAQPRRTAPEPAAAAQPGRF
ncbi:MAG TPA: O-antigen ligase [Dongiaceae bacterium]|nr:O-antigen ligase [Dongiaceae bacterium]